MQSHWPEKIEVARELWRSNSGERRATGHESWSNWYLRRALTNRDWREVKRLSQEAGEPIGTFVAGRHLNENLPMPRNPCVRLLLTPATDKRSYLSECEDERMVAMHSWQIAKSDEEKAGTQERFMRLYSLQLMDQQIGRLNFLNELRWDVDREIPDAPQALDYLLTLKELEPFAKKTSALVSNKDLTF